MEIRRDGAMYLSEAERELATERISLLFRRFAIPSVVSLVFLGLQTIIDGVVLGNVVGANALASVSLMLPCYSFMAAIAIVIGVGCQTMISIRLGEQDRQGANDALTSAFVFLVGFTLLSSALIFAFSSEIIMLLGANDVLVGDALGYLRSLVPFFPLITVMFFANYVLRSMGHPIYAMLVMTGTMVLNIGLDIFFVAVLHMGTVGAGLATGLSFTAGAVCSLPFIWRKESLLSVTRGCFKGRLVWQMFYNGSSEGLSEISSGISTLCFNLAIIKYLGETGVAAFTAINYVFFIGITVFLGISDGIIPIISYNFGAGRWDRIKKVLRLAVKTNFIIGAVLFLALLGFGEQIISLFFKSGETEVLRIAGKGTAFYAFAFLLNGLNILAASYFTAMANAKLSIVISLLRGLVFVVAGITVFPMIFGIEGVWLAVPVAEVATFAVSYWLVKRSLQKQGHSCLA